MSFSLTYQNSTIQNCSKCKESCCSDVYWFQQMKTSLYPYKLRDNVAHGVLVCLNLDIYAGVVLNEQLTAFVCSKAA